MRLSIGPGDTRIYDSSICALRRVGEAMEFAAHVIAADVRPAWDGDFLQTWQICLEFVPAGLEVCGERIVPTALCQPKVLDEDLCHHDDRRNPAHGIE